MPLVHGAADLRLPGVAFASDSVLFNLWYHTRRLAVRLPRRAGLRHCIDTVVTLGIASRSGKYVI